jgi:hypothetical protein
VSRLCVLICRLDDEQQPDQLTELQRIELPAVAAQPLLPDTTLDQLEAGALATGREVLRCLVEQQWQALDEQTAADYQRLFPPGHRQAGGLRVAESRHPGGYPAVVPADLLPPERGPARPAE